MSFERGRRIADAVLYEGYVLYPYRSSSPKNRVRWQFGVLAPRDWSDAGGCESWWNQTECLIEIPGAAETRSMEDARDPLVVRIQVRWLQAQERRIERALPASDPRGAHLIFTPVDLLEVGGGLWTTWDEGVERCVEVTMPIDPKGPASAKARTRIVPYAFEAAPPAVETIADERGAVAGRVVRKLRPLSGAIQVSWEEIVAERVGNGGHGTSAPAPLDHDALPAGYGGVGPGVRPRSDRDGALVRLTLRVENLTIGLRREAPRDEALRCSLIGVHSLWEVSGGGVFISLLDPPPEAESAAAACHNIRTWPVLSGEPGERGALLSAPIILYDHPQIAPESPGDLHDGTEIDEILTLRTMTLTDEEKRAARATDPRAAAIVDRVDAIPGEVLERLHGARRAPPAEGREIPAASTAARRGDRSNADGTSAASTLPPAPDVPWWDPGADASVSPESDRVLISGVEVGRGHRVRLRPAGRGRDAQDMFLVGRVGRVEGVYFDVDENTWLAVSLEDDPAAELMQWHGRYLYFSPNEVEPLGGIP